MHSWFGSVCGSSFDARSANLVCRQLRYEQASILSSNSYGTGNMILTSGTCAGDVAAKLTECQGATLLRGPDAPLALCPGGAAAVACNRPNSE